MGCRSIGGPRGGVKMLPVKNKVFLEIYREYNVLRQERDYNL